MITVRPSVPEDVPAQRELWKLAFGDSDQYIDNFSSTTTRSGRWCWRRTGQSGP